MCYFSVSYNIWHLLLSRVFEANPKAKIRCINLFDGSGDAPLWLILEKSWRYQTFVLNREHSLFFSQNGGRSNVIVISYSWHFLIAVATTAVIQLRSEGINKYQWRSTENNEDQQLSTEINWNQTRSININRDQPISIKMEKYSPWSTKIHFHLVALGWTWFHLVALDCI